MNHGWYDHTSGRRVADAVPALVRGEVRAITSSDSVLGGVGPMKARASTEPGVT